MKIAIHNRAGSFSEGWIQYCKLNNIEYKIVNAYDSDIVEQLNDCDAFMWHFHHGDYRDMKFARSLIKSLENKGLKTFPNSNTCWHFDNKVAQKYLLESIDAPLVPSYVFYSKEDALRWANETTFPKVFKLKGGAGASNVKLAHSKAEAIKLINQSFGEGFRQYRFIDSFKEVYRKYKNGTVSFKAIIYEIYKGLIKKYPTDFDHYHGREMGYTYFQEFIPGNEYDTRMIVVGGKYAFGEKRFVRTNDFRASGSGKFSYDDIDTKIVKVAFNVAKRLKLQSVAFDFVYGENKEPLIIEISYGFGTKGARKCPGYWTDDMKWHECKDFDFCGWMVEEIIKH